MANLTSLGQYGACFAGGEGGEGGGGRGLFSPRKWAISSRGIEYYLNLRYPASALLHPYSAYRLLLFWSLGATRVALCERDLYTPPPFTFVSPPHLFRFVIGTITRPIQAGLLLRRPEECGGVSHDSGRRGGGHVRPRIPQVPARTAA